MIDDCKLKPPLTCNARQLDLLALRCLSKSSSSKGQPNQEKYSVIHEATG